MHDIQKIRDNPKKFAELQKRRGVKIDVEEIITLDSSKRTEMTKLQNLQNERNELSKQIGLQKGKDKSGKANELINKVHDLKDQISGFDWDKWFNATMMKKFDKMIKCNQCT